MVEFLGVCRFGGSRVLLRIHINAPSIGRTQIGWGNALLCPDKFSSYSMKSKI